MLDPRIKEMAQEPNFAAVTTALPDGHFQTQPIWVTADDDYVYLNTEVDRVKYKNIERDPRVTVMIWDKDNPYRYVEVRGQVVDTVTGKEAREMIDELSQKYNGQPYPPEAIGSERVILKIAPEQQRIAA
ncbi:MAG TPA: PPOX class F420-dependent oxidoreductase [Candidatus Dormibacteraeota bacterium]|jgi:PPOX class probable F420-dependent enzyme|nr:PPOX class F420-dependent oxidoreductase [Candidatus Dormibacteraeota bacterium]